MDDPAAFRSPARAVPAEAAEGLAELRRTWLEVAAESLPGDEALVRLLTDGLDAAVVAGWPPAEAEMLMVTEQASQHAVETGSTNAARGLSKRLRRAIYEFLLSLDAASSVEQLSHTATVPPAATRDAGAAPPGASSRAGDRPELIWDEPELRVLDGGASMAVADTPPPVIAPPPPLGEAEEDADAPAPEPGAVETEDHSIGGQGWGIRSGGRRRRGPDGGRMRGGWLSRLGASDEEEDGGEEIAPGSTEEARLSEVLEPPAVPPSSVPAHVPGQHASSGPVEVELVEVPLEPPGLELVEIPLEPESVSAGEEPAAGSGEAAEVEERAEKPEPEAEQASEEPEADAASAPDGGDLLALADRGHGAAVDQEAVAMAADLDLWPTFPRTDAVGAGGEPEGAAVAPAGDEPTPDLASPEVSAADAVPGDEEDEPAGDAASQLDEAPAARLAPDEAATAEPATDAGDDQVSTPPAADGSPERPTLVVVELAPDPVAALDDRNRVPEIFRRDQPASPLVVPSYRAWADVLAAGGEAPGDGDGPSVRRSAPPPSGAAPRRAAPHQRPLPTGGLAARLRNARPQTAAPGAATQAASAPARTPSAAPHWTPGQEASAGWPEAGLTSTDSLPPFPSARPSALARVAPPPRPLEPPAPPALTGDEAWPAPSFDAAAEPMSAADAWLASSGDGQPSMQVDQRWPGGGAAAASWPRESRVEPRHARSAPAAPVPADGSGPGAEQPAAEVGDDGSWSVRRSPRQQALHERMAQRRREDAIRAATVVFDEHGGRPRKERGPELDRLRLPEQVDTLLRRKRGGEAAALMQRAAQELGGHEIAEQALDCGDRCRSLNQSRAAVNSYLAAWRADPLFEAPLWRLAESCLADREPELAVGYLERVADLMRARGEDQGALGVYRKIITVAPERGDVRALLQVAQTTGRIPD